MHLFLSDSWPIVYMKIYKFRLDWVCFIKTSHRFLPFLLLLLICTNSYIPTTRGVLCFIQAHICLWSSLHRTSLYTRTCGLWSPLHRMILYMLAAYGVLRIIQAPIHLRFVGSSASYKLVYTHGLRSRPHWPLNA